MLRQKFDEFYRRRIAEIDSLRTTHTIASIEAEFDRLNTDIFEEFNTFNNRVAHLNQMHIQMNDEIGRQRGILPGEPHSHFDHLTNEEIIKALRLMVTMEAPEKVETERKNFSIRLQEIVKSLSFLRLQGRNLRI